MSNTTPKSGRPRKPQYARITLSLPVHLVDFLEQKRIDQNSSIKSRSEVVAEILEGISQKTLQSKAQPACV